MQNKRKPLVSFLVLTLTLVLSFMIVHQSMLTYADDETTKSVPAQEVPAPEDPVKPSDPTTAKQEPVSSTHVDPISPPSSKADESSSRFSIPNPFTSTSGTEPSSATTVPDDPGSTTKSDNPGVSEQPSEKDTNGSSTSAPANTTKKTNNSGKTTTKKNNYSRAYVAPATTVPKMTVPHVDNTEVIGTTLSPMDAYFERISGDTSTEPFSLDAEETEFASTDSEHKNLSTTGIVAICLVGIGAVVCILTLAFALRNKRANEGGRPVEYDDEYDDVSYDDPGDATDESYDDAYASPAAQVDQSSQFTVVSLDDKDYRD